MDSLLPSEIARLVLGYLQEQKCEEAAKIFLETSPLLQECRFVTQKGGRYSTKVGGLNLIDILDKYCAANAMVQEKMNKVTDVETLKQCNDLLDQLRYLLGGSSRGHRFVVNISVPSQSSPAGAFGSPIVSGSNRKRHYSGSERGKRVSKSLNSLIDKSACSAVTQGCDTVEATPLESLPGHKGSTKQVNSESQTNNINEKYLSKTDSTTSDPRISRFDVSSSSAPTAQPLEPNIVSPLKNIVHSNSKDQATESMHVFETIESVQAPSKCTAGTNTEDATNYYCSTEVQTGPCDIIESESDINDEPVENLSILTKKLLQRTELHERIAENINRAIMPVETSFREENTYENPTEANISLLNDFDNAIKSVVQATETDPVFEGFLKEIFKIGETDTSPDEDSDGRLNQASNDKIYSQYDEIMEIDNNCDAVESMKVSEPGIGGFEIPLKHRLRSSSRSQNTNVDEEEKDTNSLLENQNAEAIRSIVNVIASKRNSLENSEELNKEIPLTEPVPENVVETPPNINIEVDKTEENVKAPKSTTKKSRKVKKPKEPVPEPEVMPTLILCTEKDVEEIVQRQQMEGFLPIAPKNAPPPDVDPPATIYLRTVNVPRHLVNTSTIEASKGEITANPLFLQKALNLQQQQQVGSSQKGMEKGESIVSNDSMDPIVVPIVVTDEIQRIESSGPPVDACSSIQLPTESITLYGGVNDAEQMNVPPISSMPIISLDDTTLNLASGTGLSPFFKDHIIGGEMNHIVTSKKTESRESEIMNMQESAEKTEKNNTVEDTEVEDDCPEPVVLEVEPDEDELAAKMLKDKQEEKQNNVTLIDQTTTEIITKHTPRTLLRSRAKNNRLSLSTPRRRNSHVRALDFNTPVKSSGGGPSKVPQSCSRSKSVCRAGLFKSPPFTGAISNVKIDLNPNQVPEAKSIVKRVRTVSPVKPMIYAQVPIATRSPAPKLQGNWNKYTGIGMILGDSTSESSPEKSQHENLSKVTSPILEVSKEKVEVSEKKVKDSENKVKETPTEKKSWDSDLRKIVGEQVTEESKPKTRNSKRASARKKGLAAKNDENTAIIESDTNDNIKEKTNNKELKKNNTKVIDSKKIEETGTKESTDSINISIEANIDTSEKTEITPPASVPVSKKPYLEVSNTTKSNEENDKNIKNSNLSKNSPLNIGLEMRFPNVLDLETPRKIEDALYVPPTPRLLVTPGDGLKTNRSKTDLKIKDCVDTPEFPVTPCIVVTPKIVEEDKEKKPSPYYEPENEPPARFEEIPSEKIVMQVQETTTLTIQKNMIELQENKSIEITQYGVREENIVQKDQEEQTTSNDNSKEIVEESSIEEDNPSNISTNSNSDTDNDSSDSDSSSSSSSSDSSSSTTSSGSSTTSSPTKSIIQDVSSDPCHSCQKDFEIAESKIDQPDQVMQSFSKVSQEELDKLEAKSRESSPKKVFSVVKEASNEMLKETPAKDENATEAMISETPSVTDAERALRRDSLTNLTSKISAIITTSQSDQAMAALSSSNTEGLSTTSTSRPKPRIIEVVNIEPNNMTTQVSQMLQSGIQQVKTMTQRQVVAVRDAKMSQELQDKRLRLQAKLKETKPVGRTRRNLTETKLQKKNLVMKNNMETEKVVPSITANQKNKTKPEVDSDKVDNKDIKKVERKESVSDNTKLDKKNEEEVKGTKKGKGKASPRKKTVQHGRLIKTESSSESNLNKLEKETTQNKSKEIKAAITVVTVTAENVKGISKSKVDQVKRDLFSDEEVNDQRTTRSQSARRTTIDGQKKNNLDDSLDTSVSNDSPKGKLPGVLECLELIPTNKSDQESHDLSKSDDSFGFSTSQTHVLDITVEYDESVPIKKRKRKYSTSELQSEYIYALPDEGLVHVLKPTPFIELFKITPKSVKTKTLSPKKSPSKIKKIIKIHEKPPLATSSPISATNAKIVKPDEKKKKVCKRKTSPSKEHHQVVDKKIKVDPQALLQNIKIDEFLETVHKQSRNKNTLEL